MRADFAIPFFILQEDGKGEECFPNLGVSKRTFLWGRYCAGNGDGADPLLGGAPIGQ